MLTNNNYKKGMAALLQTQYNINYNKSILFNLVCANLAEKLLNSEYADTLNDCQIKMLTKLINK